MAHKHTKHKLHDHIPPAVPYYVLWTNTTRKYHDEHDKKTLRGARQDNTTTQRYFVTPPPPPIFENIRLTLIFTSNMTSYGMHHLILRLVTMATTQLL